MFWLLFWMSLKTRLIRCSWVVGKGNAFAHPVNLFLSKGLLVFIALSLIGHQIVRAQEGWQIGAIVGLRAGTCIREGPGLNYRAHTRVPEDDWAVLVIDGPRMADGKVWWDTSRRAAGDPSGGTGWVREDQTDTDCFLPSPPKLPSPKPPSQTSLQSILLDLDLWRGLPDWVRWGAAVLLFLVGLQLVGRTLNYLLTLLGALLESAAIWIAMDLTRTFWQPFWQLLNGSIFGAEALDLALLLALLPLASWLLATTRGLVRKF